MRRILSVTLCSIIAIVYVNMRADHDKRTDIGLLEWFGLQIEFKAFLSVANAFLLNSFLFLGEIFQYFMVT